MPPNWNEIERCLTWKVLGITECDNCDGLIQCWGEETQLPEGPLSNLKEVLDANQSDQTI